MLKRKIEDTIETYLLSNSNKILLIAGARQVGKSFIVRHVCQNVVNKKYKNYVEINFVEDSISNRLFKDVTDINDFYFKLSMFAGEKMGNKDDTIVFIDEIQQYPQFLTLLKFLKQDDRFTYICSGSLLAVTLFKTPSIPIGSLEIINMYPLDFEEFLWANGFNNDSINKLKENFDNLVSLDNSTHDYILGLFKRYLLVGGMPDAVNTFLTTRNIFKVRNVQSNILSFYGDDASKYDIDHKLKIKRIYDLIPSNLENKKKRIVINKIEEKKRKRYSDYADEFDYLTNSGIAIDVNAITNPTFPLIQSSGKNLLKLYLNDVGLLTNIYYKNNIEAVLNSQNSVNLGTVYESVVASELKAHNYNLFYYDNKKNGEVDFLIDDYDDLSVVPLEVKSGKDYSIHSALNNLLSNENYHIKKGYVLSNNREIKIKGRIIYLPIYFIMFFKN